ncbi:MAG: glycosyltransferase family 2 protein, partial [Candidatus Bathyarchaeia archaeon]
MEPERIIAKPLVSVVIPTFNSEKTIEDCLKSIKNQTYRNIEIIIVDNYSQDKTIKIAKKYDVLIFSKKLGRSAARNFGAKKTMGDFLLFLDSDMVLTPKVIQECVEKIIKNKVDAIEI